MHILKEFLKKYEKNYTSSYILNALVEKQKKCLQADAENN